MQSLACSWAIAMLFLYSAIGTAQVNTLPDAYKLLYGRQLLKEKQYYLSEDVFLQVAQPAGNLSKKEKKAKPLAANGLYYLALAKYRQNNYADADSILSIIENKYPNWAHIQDYHYLKGVVNFERHNFSEAMQHFSHCTDSSIATDARIALKFFISLIGSPDSLMALSKQFPHDTLVAQALVKNIFHANDPQTRALFDSVVQQFQIKEYIPWVNADRKGWVTEEINAGLLFPFTGKSSLTTQNALQQSMFMIDYYQGMLLARDDLEQKGIRFNFYQYNTARDSATIVAILNKPELMAMDLIFGPVTSHGSDLVKNFANRYQTPCINPLSQDGSFVANSKYTYLTRPSVETSIDKAQQYTVPNFGNQNVMIFYGQSKRDSLAAYHYRKKILEKGGTVTIFKDISGRSTVSLVSLLRRTNWDNISHIFVSNSNTDEAAAFIGMLDFFQIKKPVITFSEWINSEIPLTKLQAHLMYFIVSDLFEDANQDALNEFKTRFKKETNRVASRYAVLGYDMMMFFGTMIKQYGADFGKELRFAGTQDGPLVKRYLYHQGTDNRYVRLVTIGPNFEIKSVDTPTWK